MSRLTLGVERLRDCPISRKVGLTIPSQPFWCVLFRLLKDKQPYLSAQYLIIFEHSLRLAKALS